MAFWVLVVLSTITTQGLRAQEAFTVATVPNPKSQNNSWVSDPGGKIAGPEKDRINALIDRIEKKTSAEIAVVVLPSIGQVVPKDFAVDLFKAWGIGKKGKDNGLLLLIVLDQRRWEFETGYGLEGDLPDIFLKHVGEERLVPALRAGRMGEGILNSLTAVAEKLGVPGSAGNGVDTATQTTGPGSISGRMFKSPPSSAPASVDAETSSTGQSPNLFDFSPDEQFALSFFTALYAVLITVVIPFVARSATKKKPAASGLTTFLHYGRLWVYWMIPAVLVAGLIWMARPIWMGAVLYPAGALWAAIARMNSNRRLLASKEDAYEIYQRMNKEHSIGFYTSLVLFPVPMLLFLIFFLFKLRSLRNSPRLCPNCNESLARLDEKADDFFLDEGQRKEEQLGSIDYDVWHCPKCDHVKVLPYDATFTSYNACPSCHYKTYHSVADRTIVSPTCNSSGTGERDYKCENCGERHTESYTIPRRDCSKSSSGGSFSSGSSGGSSGGSFGGGSSGGGGAGGNW